jgi:hypothetical protein
VDGEGGAVLAVAGPGAAVGLAAAWIVMLLGLLA